MSKGGGGGVSIPGPDYTFGIGGHGPMIQSDSEIKIDPLTVTSTSTANSASTSTASLDLKVEPLDIKIEPLDIKIEPLDIKIEPLKADVDTNSVIDLKPLAVDSCSTFKLAPLPPICLEQPSSQHFGFTFMGVELFGFNMSSKSDVFLHSPPKPYYHSMQAPRSKEPCEEPSSKSPDHPRSGLRVRISDQH